MKILLDISRDNEDPFIRIPLKNQLFIGDIIYFSSQEIDQMDEYEYLIAEMIYDEIEIEAKVSQRWYNANTDTLMIDAKEF